MKEELQKRIQERAYDLWRDDGQPHGKAQEYWLRAEAQILAELAGGDNEEPAAPLAPTTPTPLVSAPETSIPVEVIPGASVAEPPGSPAAVEDKPTAVKPAKASRAAKTTSAKDPAAPKPPRKTSSKTKAAPKPEK